MRQRIIIGRSVAYCATFVLGAILAYAPAGAVDKLKVAVDRNNSFLPYNFENVVTMPWSVDRVRIVVSGMVLQVKDPQHDTGLFITTYNSPFGDDLPAQVGLRQYPGQRLLSDNPVWMTIRDIFAVPDPSTRSKTVVALGYRNDSAFACKITLGKQERTWLFLGSGSDSTGDGKWDPDIVWRKSRNLGESEYEAYIYMGARRDRGGRYFMCLDPIRMKIKWSLLMSAPAFAPDFCISNGRQYGVVVTDSPSQGKSDTLFSDSYGYIVSIDDAGKIAYAAVCKSFGVSAFIAQIDSLSVYCSHDLPFQSPKAPLDTSDRGPRISKIDALGQLLRETRISSEVTGLWTAAYKGQSAIYTALSSGVYQVYDTALNLVAESEPTATHYGAQTPISGMLNGRPLLMTGDETGVVLLSDACEKLFRIPSAGAMRVEPIEVDGDGNTVAMLASGPREVVIGQVARQSLLDYLTIIYIDNRQVILAFMFALFVALVLVNAFRRRNKRALDIIARQKEELELTHQALKQAQAELVATEKYRQAKDIAGGFAHEIRNALFPAETALVKLRGIVQPQPGKEEKANQYLVGASQAVSRAIDSTRLITLYTKLDSQFLPEQVIVGEVVNQVAKANQFRAEEQHVTLSTTGPSDSAVTANREQLGLALNNLVANALDAVADRPDSAVSISWKESDTSLILTVSDNGPGVPFDQANRIFDTFFSTKPNTGTGLGLPIAKRVIELYHGTLTLETIPGQTHFIVTLPVNPESQ